MRKMYLPEEVPLSQYEKITREYMQQFAEEGIRTSAFGDIFLDDLRHYREDQLKKMKFEALFPLWKKNTRELMHQFLDLGFKTMVSCVNERFLDKDFAGRIIDDAFLAALPDNVDPCGEHGEFHTFVFDGPIFKNPVPISPGELVYKKYENSKDPHLASGFWFCDLLPEKQWQE